MIYVCPKEDYLIYRNQKGPFRKVRNFRDVEKIDLTTLVGYDGGEEVCVARENILISVKDCDRVGGECFILIRRI